MIIFCKNTMQGLIPMYGSDQDEKKKLKLGETYKCEIKRPRNLGFHKKYFALLNLAYSNTSLDMPFDTYRRYVQMKAGYFKVFETPKGHFYEAESISFGSMSQDKFEELYSRVLDVIMENLGSTQEEIENELLNFM